MNRTILAAAAVALLGTGSALAEESCTVAESDRQPEQALQQKLEADGWTVRAIEIDDGCYEVYAMNAAGERMEAHFDPQTLALVGDERDSEED